MADFSDWAEVKSEPWEHLDYTLLYYNGSIKRDAAWKECQRIALGMTWASEPLPSGWPDKDEVEIDVLATDRLVILHNEMHKCVWLAELLEESLERLGIDRELLAYLKLRKNGNDAPWIDCFPEEAKVLGRIYPVDDRYNQLISRDGGVSKKQKANELSNATVAELPEDELTQSYEVTGPVVYPELAQPITIIKPSVVPYVDQTIRANDDIVSTESTQEPCNRCEDQGIAMVRERTVERKVEVPKVCSGPKFVTAKTAPYTGSSSTANTPVAESVSIASSTLGAPETDSREVSPVVVDTGLSVTPIGQPGNQCISNTNSCKLISREKPEDKYCKENVSPASGGAVDTMRGVKIYCDFMVECESTLMRSCKTGDIQLRTILDDGRAKLKEGGLLDVATVTKWVTDMKAVLSMEVERQRATILVDKWYDALPIHDDITELGLSRAHAGVCSSEILTVVQELDTGGMWMGVANGLALAGITATAVASTVIQSQSNEEMKEMAKQNVARNEQHAREIKEANERANKLAEETLRLTEKQMRDNENAIKKLEDRNQEREQRELAITRRDAYDEVKDAAKGLYQAGLEWAARIVVEMLGPVPERIAKLLNLPIPLAKAYGIRAVGNVNESADRLLRVLSTCTELTVGERMWCWSNGVCPGGTTVWTVDCVSEWSMVCDYEVRLEAGQGVYSTDLLRYFTRTPGLRHNIFMPQERYCQAISGVLYVLSNEACYTWLHEFYDVWCRVVALGRWDVTGGNLVTGHADQTLSEGDAICVRRQGVLSITEV